MGTISSALSGANSLTSTPVTASSNSGSTNSTGIFTGTSAYSQDLQNVISRAVSIASLPIELLTNQQTELSGQATELTTLGKDLAAVQASIQAITDALGGSGMESTVSDPAVASVTVGDGASQGAYSIEVSSIGSYATSLSSAAWESASNPVGKTTGYNLVIGSNKIGR